LNIFIYIILVLFTFIFYLITEQFELQGQWAVILSLLSYQLNMSGILPVKIYKNLSSLNKFRSDLHRVGEVYGIVNILKSRKIKQYIGSSKVLYKLLMVQLKGR